MKALEPMKSKRQHSPVGCLVSLIIIAIIGGALFYVYSKSKAESGNPLTQPTKQENLIDSAKDTFFSFFNFK